MTRTEQLLRRSEAYAARFEQGDLPAPPRLKVVIVTCMDARIDPAAMFGLEPGDAHVIRNAGGVVTDDVIRSLSISQHYLGTEEILIVQHTQCGLLTITDESVAESLERATGVRPDWSARAFGDLEQSVRDGVARVREDRFIPRAESVRGFVYEVETGRLSEVA
jgi:carbonic anhydrase